MLSMMKKDNRRKSVKSPIPLVLVYRTFFKIFVFGWLAGSRLTVPAGRNSYLCFHICIFTEDFVAISFYPGRVGTRAGTQPSVTQRLLVVISRSAYVKNS